MKRRFALLFAGALALGAPLAASAADASDAGAWPERTVRLMIGFPPGQATDRSARLIADKLTVRLGQPVIVENRPGQAGSIALAALKRAAPDGYTLGIAAVASLATNPHLYKSVGYDPLADFSPVTVIAAGPLLLLANPGMPFSTVADFVKYAKENPGRLNYCSTGNGTISHLAMELFKRQAGISLTHVPYPGSVKAMGDLASGEVSVCFDTVGGSQPLRESGRIKTLGVATLERMNIMPDIPTLVESGYEGFEAAPYIVMLAPAGTPNAIIERMSRELREIGASPDMREQFRSLGTLSIFSTPQQAAQQLRTDHEKWRTVIRQADIRID